VIAEVAAENYDDQELRTVGRPGLDPGTLGLKGSSRTLRGVSTSSDRL
jgi:hypothetical protein